MSESAADRQAAQQTQEQEKKYAGDSSSAVSNDTQFADPRQASDGASFKSEGASLNEATGGEANRGESTVFGEPDQPSDTSYGTDQDAEPSTPVQGEPPQTASDGDEAQTSYGEDQDAEPPKAPYEQ